MRQFAGQENDRIALGPPGALLGVSWGSLGPPGDSWGPKRCLLGSLVASWGFLRPPVASWGLLVILGASWGLLKPPPRASFLVCQSQKCHASMSPSLSTRGFLACQGVSARMTRALNFSGRLSCHSGLLEDTCFSPARPHSTKPRTDALHLRPWRRSSLSQHRRRQASVQTQRCLRLTSQMRRQSRGRSRQRLLAQLLRTLGISHDGLR